MKKLIKLNSEQKTLLELYSRYGSNSEKFKRYFIKKATEYKIILEKLSTNIQDKKILIKLNELKKNYDKLFNYDNIDENSLKALLKLMFIKQ